MAGGGGGGGGDQIGIDGEKCVKTFLSYLLVGGHNT